MTQKILVFTILQLTRNASLRPTPMTSRLRKELSRRHPLSHSVPELRFTTKRWPPDQTPTFCPEPSAPKFPISWQLQSAHSRGTGNLNFQPFLQDQFMTYVCAISLVSSLCIYHVVLCLQRWESQSWSSLERPLSPFG